MSDGGSTNGGKPLPRIGSYKLLQSLGSGGMSSVFRAVHSETGHEVALKVLTRPLARNTTLLQRFLREAKSAESLEHPSIVAIYDRGVDQGRYYLVLEYVPGGDLHERVKNTGPLPIPEAVSIIRTVAKGLQFAAGRGLIHRDIKPANLLLTASGRVKICDLGLALQPENEDERVTREGTTVGTVDYMSPEQARDSRATSERSDIYSLGCTFYFLLTGSPPYPGGDVADKLSRHCLQPPPDPRELRPEIPAPLARLVQRMMAKRPENRFESYEELLDEIDAMPTAGERPAEEPLFALIDEDEDDSGPDAVPAGGGSPPAAPEALFALLDEDDDGDADDLPRLRPLTADDVAGRRQERTDAPALGGMTLAELAALSDEPARAAPKELPAPAPAPRSRRPLLRFDDTSAAETPAAGPRSDAQEPPLEAMVDEDEPETPPPAAAAGLLSRLTPAERKRAMVAGAALGALVLVLGIVLAVRSSGPDVPDPGSEVADTEPLPSAPPPVQPAPPERRPEVAPESEPENEPPAQVAVRTEAPRKGRTAVAKQPPAVPEGWREPADPQPVDVPEGELDAGLEEQAMPTWARSPIPEHLGAHVVTVRRVPDPKVPSQVSTVGRALEVIGATVELADNGPFFEEDLRIHGQARLIRARAGYRPIVCVEAPTLDVVWQQPGVFVLDGKSLTLDGIDLIVDTHSLPPNQSALFVCTGATLTLRNCTVTVVNSKAHTFALARVEQGPHPSRIRLEQTLVRGKATSVFEASRGAAEIVLNRSVVLSRDGSFLSCGAPAAGQERRVSIVRSVVCTGGSVLETAARPDPPVVFQAVGSSFAHLPGERPATLVALGAAADEDGGKLPVDWSGDCNVFLGWHPWMSAGGSRSVRVANLGAVRKAWPGSETRSREDSAGLSLRGEPCAATPADLQAHLPEARATLARVASPTPALLERTIGSFNRLVIPRIASPPPEAPSAGPDVPPAAAPGPGTGPATKSVAAAAGTAPVRELAFDLGASPWNGDLGLFLRDRLVPADRRVRVRVGGAGRHACTPFRLPEGVSLEVLPARLGDEKDKAAPIVWSPAAGVSAEALMEVHGGDLVLTDVRLVRDGGTAIKHLLRVEEGHLILNRCWLTAPGTVEPGGGGLIAFRARSTEPRKREAGPFQTPYDRPVCGLLDSLLMTGGDAVAVELGRGIVALANCAIASGSNALSLWPAKVARSRFEADLYLDHCTLAAQKSFVYLGPWPGTAPGPDRPWLVSSRDSAYVASYEPPAAGRESVVLRVGDDALARGTLFWQAANDAYELNRFTARDEAAPAGTLRPNVQRQWIDLWSKRHIHNTTGTSRAGAAAAVPSVRFYARIPASGAVPADLELDPSYHPGRPRLSLGADLGRLKVPTRRPRRTP